MRLFVVGAIAFVLGGIGFVLWVFTKEAFNFHPIVGIVVGTCAVGIALGIIGLVLRGIAGNPESSDEDEKPS